MKTLLMVAGLVSSTAFATDAALQIQGDLMIHPTQVASFFGIAANQIDSAKSWSWENLSFTKPYKTSWSNVVASGPFVVQFDTTNLKNQQLGFTMSWASPSITVGDFEIHDTVSQTVGGIPVTVHLDGACTGMTLNVPNGQWTVKGHMHWDFTTNGFVPSWDDFSMTTNAQAAPQVNLGQCSGQPGLIQALQTTMNTLLADQSWLQSAMNQGLLDWMQTQFVTLQDALLAQRTVNVKSSVIAWNPQTMSTLPGGLIRIAGNFTMTKPGSTVGADSLPRNYADSVLGTVTESGFVMPKDSMQHILKYMYSNGELQYRVNSSSISAFTSLMNNGFLQFFVWPDLMNFDSSTQFYFDLSTQGVPVLGDGAEMQGGGSSYNFTASMMVHQWAPANGKYVPYIDFTSPLTGKLQAAIANGNLNLTMVTDPLNISDTFRSEFAATRWENTWIATGLLGSSVNDYLNSTVYSIPVPNWQLGANLTLGMRDVQVWTQSFRIPLQFTQTSAASH